MSKAPRRLQVLVIDDSAVVRQALTAVLSSEKDIDVVVAADPLIAEQKMARFRPDVIVLDLEMPRMDGLTFLSKLMADDPLPVVVCSSYAESGSELALRALELGAVDILAKPRVGVRDFLHDSAVILIESVRGAAQARIGSSRPPPEPAPRESADAIIAAGRAKIETDRIIAVGASTGGTDALRELLAAMPADAPGMLIVQHMPAGFTAAFAKRLAESSRLDVREAKSGDDVGRGRALIAAGDRHLVLRRSGTRYFAEVNDGPLVSRHRPSVDVLFRSVAQAAGKNAVGLIMTGMGGDGAQGLLEMKQAGAATFAQDESSCVVFGMPKEAIARGAADRVLALKDLPAAVLRAANGGEPGAGTKAHGGKLK
ncbi:MAG: chemotaxis response regulator protein-glutamate methylesterase [Polyangia bacterium]|jgi:two-component system chemotaxis response regulator CheB